MARQVNRDAVDDTGEPDLDGAPQPAAPHFGLTKFLDPLPIPPVLRPHAWWHRDEITITATRAEVRLHSQLPPTAVWAYNGAFPGPTIDVHRDRTLRLSWTNGITGRFPLVAVRAAADGAVHRPGYRDARGEPLPGISELTGVADLPAWQVVHLHGSATDGGDDGGGQNAVLPGHSQLTEHRNHQQAATLWYHDQAREIAALNVHTGLAGLYLVRDDEEARLRLPSGEHELPLIITDRNLDVDPATGRLTGQLLYKIAAGEGGVDAPFTGPFTLVNGVIWPHSEVEARWYRLRLLNASNARCYALNLIDAEDRAVNLNAVARQIGTDGGLLPAPTALPEDGLVLAPGERADVLIDFGALRGRSVVLTNTSTEPDCAPEPDVLEFRVRDRATHEAFRLPEAISTSYYRLLRGSTLPEDQQHVWIALVPPGSSGDGAPQLWELAEVTDPARLPARFPADGWIQLTDPETGLVRGRGRRGGERRPVGGVASAAPGRAGASGAHPSGGLPGPVPAAPRCPRVRHGRHGRHGDQWHGGTVAAPRTGRTGPERTGLEGHHPGARGGVAECGRAGQPGHRRVRLPLPGARTCRRGHATAVPGASGRGQCPARVT
jgi:FtsP/CotA-like multicopper oxidase with cupredoxin domain